MKQVKKSVLLWYSPHEMYSLVIDVDHYSEFLPWCDRSEVVERFDDGVTARVGMAIAGVRQSFTTRNVNVPDASVHMALVDGPFSQLDGLWRFLPLANPQACKIEFELNYTFSSRTLEMVISPVFDRIANSFVEGFVKRAESVYGPR
ncbi:MAG TPA: type II toxin-antitoxin system RatA family toxin [Burkholderiaceae bacterium]|jgi:ribosome-associated toxin RatA of RatAB toxin-antitoxin module